MSTFGLVRLERWKKGVVGRFGSVSCGRRGCVFVSLVMIILLLFLEALLSEFVCDDPEYYPSARRSICDRAGIF